MFQAIHTDPGLKEIQHISLLNSNYYTFALNKNVMQLSILHTVGRCLHRKDKKSKQVWSRRRESSYHLFLNTISKQ